MTLTPFVTRPSIQLRLVAFLERLLQLLERAALLRPLVKHLGEGGDDVRRGPLLRLPQLPAFERLRTVEEALLDLDADGELRLLAGDGHAVEQLRVAQDHRAAIDAQRVLAAR